MRMDLSMLRGIAVIALMAATGSTLAAPTTSYYIYDESGHVIGEYDANGNPVQEHVYLGNRPVAVVQGGSSTGGTVDYVTTDQLNTPRVITDSSQTVIWSWDSDPFGNGQPTGSITYNLRFPGQYYDAETGHNYNYFRNYDPATGRYIESDPIGLRGGINTYAYVNGNPLKKIDPWGLAPPVVAPLPPGVPDTDVQQSTNMSNAFNHSPPWQAMQPNGPSQCGSGCKQVD